jgi:ABC-type nitrate/sulfonate/bicarbonate transport system substrate-binding protein
VAARLGAQRVGLQADVDFFTRGTGGIAESLAALEAGTVAAAALSVPAVFEANNRGYPTVIDITALRVAFASGTFGATKTTLTNRPEVAQRILRALAQGTARFKSDREYAAQIVGQYSRIEDPEALRGTVEVYAPLFDVDLHPDMAAIQAVLDVEENPAARTAKPEDLVDLRAAEAVRRSGFVDQLPK